MNSTDFFLASHDLSIGPASPHVNFSRVNDVFDSYKLSDALLGPATLTCPECPFTLQHPTEEFAFELISDVAGHNHLFYLPFTGKVAFFAVKKLVVGSSSFSLPDIPDSCKLSMRSLVEIAPGMVAILCGPLLMIVRVQEDELTLLFSASLPIGSCVHPRLLCGILSDTSICLTVKALRRFKAHDGRWHCATSLSVVTLGFSETQYELSDIVTLWSLFSPVFSSMSPEAALLLCGKGRWHLGSFETVSAPGHDFWEDSAAVSGPTSSSADSQQAAWLQCFSGCLSGAPSLCHTEDLHPLAPLGPASRVSEEMDGTSDQNALLAMEWGPHVALFRPTVTEEGAVELEHVSSVSALSFVAEARPRKKGIAICCNEKDEPGLALIAEHNRRVFVYEPPTAEQKISKQQIIDIADFLKGQEDTQILGYQLLGASRVAVLTNAGVVITA